LAAAALFVAGLCDGLALRRNDDVDYGTLGRQ
jgi:hypothetical protein